MPHSLQVCCVLGRQALYVLTMWKSLQPCVPDARDIRARSSWIAAHPSTQCGRAFSRGSNLGRHERTHPSEERRHDTHGGNNSRAVLTSVHSKTTGDAPRGWKEGGGPLLQRALLFFLPRNSHGVEAMCWDCCTRAHSNIHPFEAMATFPQTETG